MVDLYVLLFKFICCDPNSNNNHIISDLHLIWKTTEFTRDENRCIKADALRRCHVSQVPLSYRPGGVANSFSMPLYRPFPTQPSSPFSRSRPVCLFLFADGCPYFSLYPLRTRCPSRLETPFSSAFSLYPAIYFFFSHILSQLSISSSLFASFLFFFSPSFSVCPLHLLRTQLFHLLLGQMPRLGATSPLLSLFLPFLPWSLLYFSLSVFLSFAQYPTFCNSLDKSEPIMKNSSVDDELGFLLPVLLDLCWFDVVRCLDVTSWYCTGILWVVSNYRSRSNSSNFLAYTSQVRCFSDTFRRVPPAKHRC